MAHTCEQVEFVGMDRELQLPLFYECADEGELIVEWGELGMHPGRMLMCNKHAHQFEADREAGENTNITWLYIRKYDAESLFSGVA